MLPGNKLSTLEKIKTLDSASPEADMLPLAAQKSLVDNTEEDEECQTPKSKEHKMPPLLCCPPAQPKVRSVKKMQSTSPPKGVLIPSSHPDLFWLFSHDQHESEEKPHIGQSENV